MNPVLAQNSFFTLRGSTALWIILEALSKKKEHLNILIPINICEIVLPILRKVDQLTFNFYDVNSATGNAELHDIQKQSTSKTNVLLAVHNFGKALDITDITDWCSKRNIFLIEDVCNALGGTYNEKPLGSFGDAAIFSFGYAKIIEHGIGGALTIKDSELFNLANRINNTLPMVNRQSYLDNDHHFQSQIRTLRNGDKSITYTEVYDKYVRGFFFQLDPTDEIKITHKLGELSENVKRRNHFSQLYHQGINNPGVSKIAYQNTDCCWRYTFTVLNKRDSFIQHLRENNILASAWYPPLTSTLSLTTAEKFPQGETFGNHVVNIFVDFRVDEKKVLETIELINNFTF